MITDLTREFKLQKVPKVVISPDDDTEKQFNKFWTYMYKSMDVGIDADVMGDIQAALKLFFGDIEYSYEGKDAHSMLKDGNDKTFGKVENLGYYGRIGGKKVNNCLESIRDNESLVESGGVGIHFVDRDSRGILASYENMAVLVDYSALNGCSSLGFKKNRTTLFKEATSIRFEKGAYVVILVDGRALWLAYKFAELLGDCMEGVDLGEPDKYGRYKLGYYAAPESSLSFDRLLGMFVGDYSSKMKGFVAMCLGLHPAFQKMLKLLHSMYTDRIMMAYQEEYIKELGETQAKVFQTKKHITKEKLELMATSKLLGRFSFVEIDNDIDNDTYKFIESAISKVPFLLPQGVVELRFRKLGNYQATGLWFPYINNLCVDIRDVSSFIHEYGHAIDYLLTNDSRVPLSMQVDFVDIRTKVFKDYQASKIFKLGYYGAPTEIFARAFEVYVVNEGYITNLVKNLEDMKKHEAYKPYFDEEFYVDVVKPYFDKLLGSNVIKNRDISACDIQGVLVCGKQAIYYDDEIGNYVLCSLEKDYLSNTILAVEVTEHLFMKLVKVLRDEKLTEVEKFEYIRDGYSGLFYETRWLAANGC